MSRKDVIIEEQQKEIERLTNYVETYMKKNHLLMATLIETEKRLRKYEEGEDSYTLSDFAEKDDN